MSMDFCGFSFNGHHSSEMGLLRVSNGSRYSEDMIPNFQDKTSSVPGGDGTYFFESYYTQKPFGIDVAFDSINESQFRLIRQVFNGKTVGPLIYDERPYKAYIVKVQSAPQLKYICFDERGSRVYKGEGTIQFVSYAAYAHSVHKFLDEYHDENKSEWAASSGLLESQTTGGVTYDEPGTSINLYNAGDIDADFKIFFSISSYGARPTNTQLTLKRITNGTEEIIGELLLAPVSGRSIGTWAPDTFFCIDSKTNLIEGYSGIYERTGTLYNDYILSGDFFKIPISTSNSRLVLEVNVPCTLIQYHYLYY